MHMDDNITSKKTNVGVITSVYTILVETTTFQVVGMLRLNGQRLGWMDD